MQCITTIIPKAESMNGVFLFGRNPQVDTASDPEDVWFYGGLKTLLAVAATLYISSDSTLDTGVEITVEYLDSSWEAQTIISHLHAGDGRIFVSLGVTAWRVNRAWVSNGSPLVGNVFVSSDPADVGGDGIPDDVTKIEGYIPAADQQTLQAIYTIPAGRIGRVISWYGSLISNVASSRAVIRLAQRQLGRGKRTVELLGISNAGSPMERCWPMSQPYPARTTLCVEVAEVSHNNLDIAAGYYLWLDYE